MAAINQAIAMKRLFEIETGARAPGGSPAWTHSRAVPILNADGEIVECLARPRMSPSTRKVEEAQKEGPG
jgi:hypothetical protein